MYSFLKKHIKTVFPKHFLFKNELLFRYFYGIFYRGDKYQCNICLKKLNSFIQLENGDLLCPFCGSLSRNRRLWQLINEKNCLNGNILHFSPSRSLFRLLKITKTINYYSSDFENEFLADYKFNITNINQEDAKFDTIICYHILEHILDDKKAMSELYRVLKSNGAIIIQTPFKEGDNYEDETIIDPNKRKAHFGQVDHVRIYSVEGLKQRLENIGFKVQVENFNKQTEDLFFGFKSPETVLIARK
jgi:SAM-dependent methyltransferase